ncbi:MAG TPA: L-ribulose-5-phosphate 3-epimerase [Candidatus Cryosericum sp.]|nr:L-ribulose-5-phosphate 3-epimerase [Candidatus Cryosericum sp.]
MLGKHLLGLYEKALPAGLGWQERFAVAKRLGFDFVELSVDETDERLGRLYWNESQRRELADAINDTGMRLQSICLSAHRRFPFGSEDAVTRKKAMDIAERSIQFALEFGVRVIQVAGYDVYYEPSTEQTRERFLEGLGRFVSLAEQYQIMLAVEIMDTDYINSISAYQRVKAEVASPWFTVYPDMGNLSAWNRDVLCQLENGRDEIVAVHIKDTIAPCKGFAGQFKDVPFGTGCVDFPAVFQKLEEIEFHGPYLLELWHRPGTNAEFVVSSALAFVREQFEKGVRS